MSLIPLPEICVIQRPLSVFYSIGSYSSECACLSLNYISRPNRTTVILMARTLALYNFNPWIIASMCVLVVVLVVSHEISSFRLPFVTDISDIYHHRFHLPCCPRTSSSMVPVSFSVDTILLHRVHSRCITTQIRLATSSGLQVACRA